MPPAGTRISHSFEPVIEPVIEPNTQTASKIHSIERGSGSSKPKGLIPNGERFSAQPNRAPADPQTASTPLSSRYAFEGSVIRLNPQDFARWQALFPHLALTAELTRLDLEFSHDRPKSWFSTASAKLNYQNKQAMGVGYARQKFKSVSGDNFASQDYGTTVLPAWMKG